jgi:hypothetical protein
MGIDEFVHLVVQLGNTFFRKGIVGSADVNALIIGIGSAVADETEMITIHKKSLLLTCSEWRLDVFLKSIPPEDVKVSS